MKKIFAASGVLLILSCSLAASAAEYTSTLVDQKTVSVTIYNQNLALIKDRRTITLPAGENVLSFREVSAQIKPETALLTGEDLDVFEQNFEYDLLTPQTMLQKYVGREVTVIRTHPTTGEETREQARVLSANNGVVLQIGGQIETGIPGRLAFDHVPENLRDKPTLTMLTRSTSEKSREVELSYLTGGMGWQADYVAELNETNTAMDINGWVTLTNQSGASYNDANLKLVAGDVNQVQPEQPARRLQDRVMAASVEMQKGMGEEQMFEYHLYSLDRPTTICDNQTKQVALLQAGKVPCSKELILQGGDYYYRSQYGEIGKKMKIGVFVETENSKKNNLGLPMPRGVVRVYKKDSRDRLQFVGEDRIDHTPENEQLRLKLGDSFDVTANRKQTDFKKVAGFSGYNYIYESAFQIELKNGSKEAAAVKVVEPIPGDWEILEESIPHEKAAANTALWQVQVPSLGSALLMYRVRVKY